MDPPCNEVLGNLITFGVAEWILRSWHFGALDVSKCAFSCCKYLFVFGLLEYMFDARACDLSFLGVEMFI